MVVGLFVSQDVPRIFTQQRMDLEQIGPRCAKKVCRDQRREKPTGLLHRAFRETHSVLKCQSFVR